MRDTTSPDTLAGTLAARLAVPAAAPHRLLFLGGAIAVLLSMTWWTAELAAGRLGWRLPQPTIPPGWAHAMLAQYGMLPFFIFGFLLTVFPRWLGQPALPRRRYLGVFGLQMGGYLLAHAGLLGRPHLLQAGFTLMLAAAALVWLTLAGVLRRSGRRDRHALSSLLALGGECFGLAAFDAYLVGASPWWALLAIQAGTFGYLLPVYLTVCHRMIPFFSANVVAGYRVVRPDWTLLLLWPLLLAHLMLAFAHAFAWLWLADLPLAVLLGALALAWQPWKAMRPGLLAALHIAFAWAPVAFVLYTLQSVVLLAGGSFLLGRAPLHALAIGFFGSMLLAMVTRVTQGHSGRPLRMGAVAWFGFAVLQGVAVARIVAAVSTDHHSSWLLLAVSGWLLAFLPWVLRSAWIYLTPRVDGCEG
ncbi:NnrS family protein [Oleiagrimonas sp. C23AA]|uniref:NnrS family protein n=1 Tax=Oleiagrimonas sp. C23AA TaxID=2719047 RepID=UPI00141F8ED0|nr:NnrS family protein [Oleiagrimonas sp. C23AA]NII11850.1 NnrS family protein [Oleiagrimonas sp. C23AA]